MESFFRGFHQLLQISLPQVGEVVALVAAGLSADGDQHEAAALHLLDEPVHIAQLRRVDRVVRRVHVQERGGDFAEFIARVVGAR